jgi:hypothetical protein
MQNDSIYKDDANIKENLTKTTRTDFLIIQKIVVCTHRDKTVLNLKSNGMNLY